MLRTAEGDGQQVLAMRLPADDDGPPAAADTAVGGDTSGGGGVLGGRAVAALDALASRVVCAAPEWHLEVGTDGEQVSTQ